MSIAYLDPGNIESDLQSGAVAKFKVMRSCAVEVVVILPNIWDMLGCNGRQQKLNERACNQLPGMNGGFHENVTALLFSIFSL